MIAESFDTKMDSAALLHKKIRSINIKTKRFLQKGATSACIS